MKLALARWLGDHLPFDWAPRWVNNRLARWMWRVPGFDVPRAADLPDTFVERAVQVAQRMPEPNGDTVVILSAFEASAIRRTFGAAPPQEERV